MVPRPWLLLVPRLEFTFRIVTVFWNGNYATGLLAIILKMLRNLIAFGWINCHLPLVESITERQIWGLRQSFEYRPYEHGHLLHLFFYWVGVQYVPLKNPYRLKNQRNFNKRLMEGTYRLGRGFSGDPLSDLLCAASLATPFLGPYWLPWWFLYRWNVMMGCLCVPGEDEPLSTVLYWSS